jgi:hypothetical protein
MNRLELEVLRLYLLAPPEGQDTQGSGDAGLIDGQGRVRALVMELGWPADWALLSSVWNGVQVDLDWPAPAIAVSGTQAYQLWFSLAEPVPAARAMAVLDALRVRYLGELKPQRLALWPTADADADADLPPQLRHARRVPAAQAGSGLWSAFVAPELAPVFADEPWLDLPPTPDAQAVLLSRLKSTPLVDIDIALERLRPATVAVAPLTAASDSPPTALAGTGHQPGPSPALSGEALDPKRFLLDVMGDQSVPLALRIEAAKALLPYGDAARQP